MTTGHRPRLPAGTRLKDGKLTKAGPRSVSAKIAQRKSKRIRPVRRTV